MKLSFTAGTTTLAVALVAATFAQPAHAHRAWILPHNTVLAGDAPMVTMDAAISNDIFVMDYRAFNADSLAAWDTYGQELALENLHTGRFRTSFDLTLAEPGTYRVASASAGLSARWVNSDGSRGFFPGRGQGFDDEQFDQAVPEDASEVAISQVSRRIETFVTYGQPNFEVIAPSGTGLEVEYLTHPNDLYSGEYAELKFLIDGEPAVGATITVIKDGMKYRDQQQALELESDSNGQVVIELSEPGMYWLEARYEDDQAKAPASVRRGTYVVTLEVLAG